MAAGRAALAAPLATLLFVWSSPASALRVHPQEENITTLSKNQWRLTEDFMSFSTKPAEEMRDTTKALACLRQTTPSLEGFTYPEDAEMHVREIREALMPFSKGEGHAYVGSFHVEDMWNLAFADAWFNRTDKSMRLWQFFGPYIPIFVQWVHPWLEDNNKTKPRMWYPKGMIDAFRKVIRKDVLYAAVSQNDEGLVGHQEFSMKEFPNIVVFSAGGYGHIPVPLVNTQGRFFKYAKDNFDNTIRLSKNRVSLPDRKYFTSYVGSLTHAPESLRERMKGTVEDWARANNMSDKVLFYHGDRESGSWREVMLTTRFTLTPRGYGRTAYHLVETIQRGLIPIFIYTDMPWIPYPSVFKTMGYVTTLDGLPSLLDKLRLMSDAEVSEREEVVLARANSHFTADTVMAQIKSFLTGGSTDLVCQKLPDSPTAGHWWR